MELKPNLVSVVIPAYNQPEYLRRALESVLRQEHRPIEVIVSDDASPTDLKPVADEFASATDGSFRLRYYRAPSNRGVIDNFRFAVGQAEGRYLVPLPHDNCFTDPRFFAEALGIMQSRPDCRLCYANAVYEGNDRVALNIPGSIDFDAGWAVLPGDRFIRLYRRGGMDWSQAMVLDHLAATARRVYDEPYVVNGEVSRRLGIAQDDMFSYVFLLSALGSVALCAKPVCEIGTPPESYSRSAGWRNTKGKVKFYVFYNVWRSDVQGPHAREVRKMARRQALQYADSILDARIGRYYGWRPHLLLMMALGLIKGGYKRARLAGKRLVNAVRPNTYKKLAG